MTLRWTVTHYTTTSPPTVLMTVCRAVQTGRVDVHGVYSVRALGLEYAMNALLLPNRFSALDAFWTTFPTTYPPARGDPWVVRR